MPPVTPVYQPFQMSGQWWVWSPAAGSLVVSQPPGSLAAPTTSINGQDQYITTEPVTGTLTQPLVPAVTTAIGTHTATGNPISVPFPRGRAHTMTLGRYPGADRVQIAYSGISGVARISRSHAAIHHDGRGNYSIRDLGSTNGTIIFRDDPVRGNRDEIPVNGNSVALRDGDVLSLGSVQLEWRSHVDGGSLTPTQPVQSISSSISVAESSVPRVQERDINERLREVADGRVVELFIENSKEKYVGRVELFTGSDGQQRVRMLIKGRPEWPVDQVLTVRDRQIDLTAEFIHPRIQNPQFTDRSINVSGTDGSGKVVLVDFADPRLQRFLEAHMGPIRQELDAGRITQQQAAERAWRIVRDYVPYDHARLYSSIPNQMYRLGDFIERGVCNERGMLLQVAYQYIGVEGTRMEKGQVPGGRHAWVRGIFGSGRSRQELILDPQRNRVLEVGRHFEAVMYHDDATSFAQPKAMTIMISQMSETGDYREDARSFLSAEGVNVERALDILRHDRFARSGTPLTDIMKLEHIETSRMAQMHQRLWVTPWGEGQLLYNRAYEALSPSAQQREQREALSVYSALSQPERDLLWRAEGRTPDGLFPRLFLEMYYESRVEQHEQGTHPFGEVAGLRTTMLSEVRSHLAMPMYQEAHLYHGYERDIRRTMSEEIVGYEELDTEIRDEIAREIERLWRDFPLLRDGATTVNTAFVRQGIELYQARHPQVMVSLLTLDMGARAEALLAQEVRDFEALPAEARLSMQQEALRLWRSHPLLRDGARHMNARFIHQVVEIHQQRHPEQGIWLRNREDRRDPHERRRSGR